MIAFSLGWCGSSLPGGPNSHSLPPSDASQASLPVSVVLNWGSLQGAETPCSQGEGALLPQSLSGFPASAPARAGSHFPCLLLSSSVLLFTSIVSDQPHFHWLFSLIALQCSCKSNPGLGANEWNFQLLCSPLGIP